MLLDLEATVRPHESCIGFNRSCRELYTAICSIWGASAWGFNRPTPIVGFPRTTLFAYGFFDIPIGNVE